MSGTSSTGPRLGVDIVVVGPGFSGLDAVDRLRRCSARRSTAARPWWSRPCPTEPRPGGDADRGPAHADAGRLQRRPRR